MPTPTYTPLANITLGSSANPVTFSSISQSYKDLVLVITGNIDASGATMVRFNLDSGSNYSYVLMQGNGSTTFSTSVSTNLIYTGVMPNSTTNVSTYTVQIMDYSATDKHKTALVRSSDSANLVHAIAGRWANTSAITTIEVYGSGASFRAGTTMALYGIAA